MQSYPSSDATSTLRRVSPLFYSSEGQVSVCSETHILKGYGPNPLLLTHTHTHADMSSEVIQLF